MEKSAAIIKKEKLIHELKNMDSLLVAFSGGVDSTFLLVIAHQVLGEKALAVTVSSAVFPSREREKAVSFSRDLGISHILFPFDETALTEFISNDPNRCYYCKKAIFKKLINMAKQRGIKHVVHGANMDDLEDYRPGHRAAREMGVKAPLMDAGLTKDDIRFLSRDMGLTTWDKPAMACLASRIPYGEPITEKKLKMIEDAESFLEDNGFTQFRVRHHGTVARIEVKSLEVGRITEPEFRKILVEKLKNIGFLHVTVDLEGYVSGSLNREIETREKESLIVYPI